MAKIRPSNSWGTISRKSLLRIAVSASNSSGSTGARYSFMARAASASFSLSIISDLGWRSMYIPILRVAGK